MLFGLLQTLWETEVDGVGEVEYPDADVSSRRLFVPSYPELRLSQKDRQQSGESSVPTEMYGLVTADSEWFLRTSPDAWHVSIGEREQSQVIDSPLMQAYYEDDIHTVAGIYRALQIPLPEEVTTTRI